MESFGEPDVDEAIIKIRF